MSKLDADKFEAVCKLMNQGATEGERTAARAAAERLASKAGMTLEEAMKISSPSSVPAPESKPKSFFEEMFNSPEFQEIRRERERERSLRQEQALREYGSVDAIFTETEQEVILSKAVEEFKVWESYRDQNGQSHEYVRSLLGDPNAHNLQAVSLSLIKAIQNALPLPDNLASIMSELKHWEELYSIRELFGAGDYEPWVRIRVLILENILQSQPAKSWADLDARLEWMQHLLDREMDVSREMNVLRLRLSEDHRIVREGQHVTVDDGQIHVRRRNADKAAVVKQLLKDMPNASARQIAKLAGVSPQTVVNWKRRCEEAAI